MGVGWLSRALLLRVRSTPRKSDRLSIYKRLADIARYHLDDEEQAVIWHREVLRLSATEKASLQFCVDYFSAREDWVGLASVYEAALRTRRRGADELAMLIQIGMILWRKVADLDRAERYFLRIKQINQRHPLMLDFYADLYTQRSDYKRLIHVLTARQSAETDEISGFRSLLIATIAEEKLGNRKSHRPMEIRSAAIPPMKIELWRDKAPLRFDR